MSTSPLPAWLDRLGRPAVALALVALLALAPVPSLADGHEPAEHPVEGAAPPAESAIQPASSSSSGQSAATQPQGSEPQASRRVAKLVPGTYAGTRCGSADPAQAAHDEDALSRIAATGLQVSVARQCAGFSVLIEQGVDPAILADLTEGLEAAYARLAADAGGVLERRAGFFVFTSPAARQLAIQAVQARPRSEVRNEKAPAFASDGDVWMRTASTDDRMWRLQVAYHELAHLFIAAGLGGAAVPNWLDEGLATHYQYALLPAQFAEHVEWQLAQDRHRTLDALTGRTAPGAFALGDVSSEDQWDANYAVQDRQWLQYSQAHLAVRRLMDRAGMAGLWRIFREVGGGASFDAALQAVYGAASGAFEAGLREHWTAEASTKLAPTLVTVTLAPGGVTPDTLVSFITNFGDKRLGYLARNARAGTYTFEVRPDGTVAETSGKLELRLGSTDAVRRGDSDLQVFIQGVAYRGARGDTARGIEYAFYRLSYGRWMPHAGGNRSRYFSAPGSSQREFMSGAMTDPFPDGNVIALKP